MKNGNRLSHCYSVECVLLSYGQLIICRFCYYFKNEIILLFQHCIELSFKTSLVEFHIYNCTVLYLFPRYSFKYLRRQKYKSLSQQDIIPKHPPPHLAGLLDPMPVESIGGLEVSMCRGLLVPMCC